MRTVTQRAAHVKAAREALSESRKRGPKFWALAVEIHFAIAAVTDSDYAAEMLILDYLQSLPKDKEPPCLVGRTSSHPVTGRPIVFSPHTWGTDNGRGLQIMMHWPNSQVVGTQRPVPLETGPAGEISNTEQVAHRLLVPFGALPEGRYTNDLVRLPRSIIVDILRFGRLPIPPELLEPAPTSTVEPHVTAAVEPVTEPTVSTPTAPIKQSPGDWIQTAKRKHPRRAGEKHRDWAKRLVELMKTASVEYVWTWQNMERRLRDKNKADVQSHNDPTLRRQK